MNNEIHWDLVRTFLAVSRLGSLSAAARELGVSQPTLTRNVQALEHATKLNLFRRTTQGLQLTDAGQSLMAAALHMDDGADMFARQVSGLSAELAGDVRISVNEIIGVYLLPAAITAFRQQHPGVQIELVISNKVSNLSKRDADIALRMFRPEQPDLVAKRLPDMALGFYAHRDYLARHGEPKTPEEFLQHTIIGEDENTEFIDGAARLGFPLTRNNFALRTDHNLAQINLGRAGAGIFVTHVALARQWPELQQVLEWIPLPAMEFWIVCHSDVQYNSRIRALMNFLGQWFAKDPYQQLVL